MTLDEAIKHCNEVACKHDKCAMEHKQLAEWLKELKELRSQPQWKPNEEQMEALEHFIVYHNGSTNYAKDLEELRLQLKKLRE